MRYYAAPHGGPHRSGVAAGPSALFRRGRPLLRPPSSRRPKTGCPSKRRWPSFLPQANPGTPLIPQLLAKDGSCAAWMIGVLRQMGYREVNLNLGCPSGTVTAKGKGAGMLRDLDALDRFLDTVFSEAGGPISVKTRIGVEKPEEFGPHPGGVTGRYPIAELIIHPPGDAPALPGPGRPAPPLRPPCPPAKPLCATTGIWLPPGSWPPPRPAGPACRA